MSLDSTVRAYLDEVAASGSPPFHELTPQDARAAMEALTPELFGAVEPVGAVVDRTIPGPVRIRIYEPPAAERNMPVLVYFHGGGWVVGSLETHDGICRALCVRTPCAIVSVDYRLAPEHRYPAAVGDAWAATCWVAEHAASIGGDASRIAVGGDSAGGNLAAVVAIRARDRGLRLASQLLVYPATDCRLGQPSYRKNGNGYGLTLESVRWFYDHYLGPDGSPDDPEASPLLAAGLADVAPALVLTVEYDPLRDEADEYARRLVEAGVPTTHICLDGLIHGVLRMPAAIPRASELFDACVGELRRAFYSSSS